MYSRSSSMDANMLGASNGVYPRMAEGSILNGRAYAEHLANAVSAFVLNSTTLYGIVVTRHIASHTSAKSYGTTRAGKGRVHGLK